MLISKRASWEDIISSYKNNPRDVKTVPLQGTGIWFNVYVENENIYIDRAKNHSNSSIIRNRRSLEKEKIDVMLSLYYRRKKGEAVAQEAKDATQNQVYWYGIFADMDL